MKNFNVVKDYFTLCKPRVVALMILTSAITMFLASPHGVSFNLLLVASLGIALSAGAGATINQLIDAKIDKVMGRTQKRPIPAGRVKLSSATIFAIILMILSQIILILWVNLLTAVLCFLTLIGYAIIYTRFLKRATPQNIVIGGLAGAMPPLLGWTAVTGQINVEPLLLVLIIFMWTPPHFWALAIERHHEYAKADIPMLPVTHGLEYTRLNVLVYTVLLILVTYLTFVINMTGIIYLIGITLLNLGFLYYSIQLYLNKRDKIAYKTFRYSVIYLALVFALLLVDHYYKFLIN